MPELELWPLQDRELRVNQFCALVSRALHLQLAVRQVRTVDDLTALARRHGIPMEPLDIALHYRFLDQPYWPWYGRPMQVRRHFVHLGRLP